MKNTLLLFASIALTVLCWGMYGPVLRSGQEGMSDVPGEVARLRPFVCVGLAYFLIGVIVAGIWLYVRGEKGDWTLRGILWSLAGGALGAIGALGIVLAFTFGGRPIYVMPLVFGGAPVVNAFLTIYMARRVKDIGPLFLAGLIIVILGAVVVLVASPHGPPPLQIAEDSATAAVAPQPALPGFGIWIGQLLSIALTIVSWGAYGPTLHKGQAAMQNSRLRPLVCVGLAYFAVAVIVPNILLTGWSENSHYSHVFGTMWSLLAGAAGAIGALGVIMAFNFGGKPVYVMPLIFGGAPVVHTLFSAATKGMLGDLSPMFLAGLMVVIAGSAMVLVFAPRGMPPKKPEEQSRKEKEQPPEKVETAESAEPFGSS